MKINVLHSESRICRSLLVVLSIFIAEAFADDAVPACPIAGETPGNSRKLVAVAARESNTDADSCAMFLSWRFLKSDAPNTSFNIYRITPGGAVVKLQPSPLVKATNFVDQGLRRLKSGGCGSYRWLVESKVGDKVTGCSVSSANLTNAQSRLLDFSYPVGAFGRSISVGSLISGSDDYLVVRIPDVTVDPYFRLWRKVEGLFYLQAVDINGKHLWSYDMGAAIEPGIWYSPYLIFDLDGDGRSELIVKSGEKGASKKQLTDSSGRVTRGKEFLSIIDGSDGNTILSQAPWPDRSGFNGGMVKDFEDYNRYSRNLMAIAYLDGIHPHVVVVRGTYGKHKVHAYRYRAKQGLSRVWSWENSPPQHAANSRNLKKNTDLEQWWGQGAHTIRSGDIDADGKDEVIIGSVALDDNGQPLWSINRGHVDHIHLGDLIPQEPGLEMYFGAERRHNGGGMGMVRARTGEFLWRYNGNTRHIHKEGVCANFLASSPGLECFSGEADQRAFWLWSSRGAALSRDKLDSLSPFAAYWGQSNKKWHLRTVAENNQGKLLDIVDLESGKLVDRINLPKDTAKKDLNSSRVLAVADILGDWREEILVAGRGRILVYTSNHPTTKRKPWLMSDHIYAMGAALSSMGYYQQPILGELETNDMSSLGQPPKK
ncbi:MAG: hypothetical protein KTR17_04860 [Cellvibrionaceae bacterium]|nr:hypothetical protein [Cellvibrionaceae bacterium]